MDTNYTYLRDNGWTVDDWGNYTKILSLSTDQDPETGAWKPATGYYLSSPKGTDRTTWRLYSRNYKTGSRRELKRFRSIDTAQAHLVALTEADIKTTRDICASLARGFE